MNLKKVLTIPIAAILFTCVFAVTLVSAGEHTAEFKSEVEDGVVEQELEYYLQDLTAPVTLELNVSGVSDTVVQCIYDPADPLPTMNIAPAAGLGTQTAEEYMDANFIEWECEREYNELELELKYTSAQVETATAKIIAGDGVTITHESQHKVSGPTLSKYPYEMESEWNETLPAPAPTPAPGPGPIL